VVSKMMSWSVMGLLAVAVSKE